MENHMKEYPDHKLMWLEPESEYNPDSYYNRIISIDYNSKKRKY